MDKIIKYYNKAIDETEKGFILFLFRGILFVLSLFYRAGIEVVNILYRTGIKKQYKVSVPVVSVGNLTLGGTGKTPFSVFVAKYYKSIGLKPAILTRGYGNDENKMLGKIPDVDVFVGQDRIKSSEIAISNGNNILILDDGFQHRRIKRDLDIVILNSENPFSNEEVFPRGMLREPIKSMDRADMVILSKVDRLNEEKISELCKEVKDRFNKDIFATFKYRMEKVIDFDGKVVSKDVFLGKKSVLVSGIGDPNYFHHIARIIGIQIIDTYVYSDHYPYTQDDIDFLNDECEKKGADVIFMTEKDFIKIQSFKLTQIKDKIRIMCVEVEIEKNEENLIRGFYSIVNN